MAMVVVEKFPATALRQCDGLDGRIDLEPLLYCGSRLAQQNPKIALEIAAALRPFYAHRAMPGDRTLGGDRLEDPELLQPAFQAAIKRRHTLDKKQIRCDQGAGLTVENGEVGVGMGDAVRLQLKHPIAQINLRLVMDEKGRHDDGTDRIFAQYRLAAGAVVLPAQRQGTRQPRMADIHRMIRAKGTRAENMIRMHMRHQYIADGQRRD